jgi:hypothetical protein
MATKRESKGRPPARRAAAAAPAAAPAATGRETALLELRDGAIRRDLSAVAAGGARTLWLASDEGASLERLTRLDDGRWGAHASFPLADLLALPGAADDEVDLEGIAAADDWLWVVGSHSAKRKKAKAGKDRAKQIARLATVETGGNRNLLARIPLLPDDDGGWRPVATREDGARAARLDASAHGGALLDALRADPHIGPFVGLPGKENGFDIEGIAAAGKRVFVGLRGPVLRGWAILLALAPEPVEEDPSRLALAPIGPGGEPYEKHFLDLRGLGARDLCLDGDDLLILAGPTMTLDGDALVMRWRAGARARGESLVGRDELEVVAELPYGRGDEEGIEHPEGLAIVEHDGERRLLITYDSPRAARLHGEGGVRADLLPLR